MLTVAMGAVETANGSGAIKGNTFNFSVEM